jgi:hypothetical protein
MFHGSRSFRQINQPAIRAGNGAIRFLYANLFFLNVGSSVEAAVRRPADSSRLKKCIVSNSGQAFVQRTISVNFYPLPGVSHEREIETAASHILQTGEFDFKEGRYGIGTRRVIFGTEVKIIPVPPGINVYNVIETHIFRRRLNVLGFQDLLN